MPHLVDISGIVVSVATLDHIIIANGNDEMMYWAAFSHQGVMCKLYCCQDVYIALASEVGSDHILITNNAY